MLNIKSSKNLSNLGTIVCVLTFLYFSLKFPIVFASESNIVLEPPFQEITIDEGVVDTNAKIKITNNTQSELTFSFQILEIKQMDEQGNVGFINKPQTAENPLAWFIEKPTNTTVPNNQTKELELKIKNSIDLSPGGHYVALVAKTEYVQENQQTQISPAISSFILVKKRGGEVYQLSLKNLDNKGWYKNKLPSILELKFENQGNTHTTPNGVVEIKDIFGRLIKKGIVNESSSIILPGAQRAISVQTYDVSKNYPIMINTLTVKGTTNPGDITFQQNLSFIYVSSYSYLLLVPILLLAIWLIKKHANKKS